MARPRSKSEAVPGLPDWNQNQNQNQNHVILKALT